MLSDKNDELQSELRSIIDEKHNHDDDDSDDNDPTCIDYHILAEILPKPPNLPIPLEPIFNQNELENLTLGKYGGIKFCVENSSQTELSELSDLNEIKQKLNSLSVQLFNEYSKHLDRVKNASNYQIQRMIEEAVLKIYLLMQSRVDNITRGYTSTIERVRGACRTQLSNTIAILNGLINAAKRRNESFIESSLRNRISELETALQQYELDMKQLQTKLKEVEENYDILNSERTNIIMSRNSSLESFSSEKVLPKVIIVHTDAGVQVDTPDEKKQSLERQVKNLLEQIDVLKSALSAVQSQVKTLNEKHDQYELQLKSFNDQINECKADNSKLEKQLLNKENELIVCKQKMKSSELRLNEMSTSMNKLRGEKAQLENDYAKNRDIEMKQLKQKLDELLKIKETLDDECNSLRKELMHMKEVPKVVESSDVSMNNYALREQALVAEIVRLRRDLNRLHEASESRIQCLKNRLNAFTEEAFNRRTIEMKVSQLHTAALKYANQLAELTPINKLHGCDETMTHNGVFLSALPPPVSILTKVTPHRSSLELGISTGINLPPIVRPDY